MIEGIPLFLAISIAIKLIFLAVFQKRSFLYTPKLRPILGTIRRCRICQPTQAVYAFV